MLHNEILKKKVKTKRERERERERRRRRISKRKEKNGNKFIPSSKSCKVVKQIHFDLDSKEQLADVPCS
jgi:hypothetical protein